MQAVCSILKFVVSNLGLTFRCYLECLLLLVSFHALPNDFICSGFALACIFMVEL